MFRQLGEVRVGRPGLAGIARDADHGGEALLEGVVADLHLARLQFDGQQAIRDRVRPRQFHPRLIEILDEPLAAARLLIRFLDAGAGVRQRPPEVRRIALDRLPLETEDRRGEIRRRLHRAADPGA